MKLPRVCSRPPPKKKCGSSSSRKKKCFKPGRVVRNSFFNFLRDFRKKHCGLPVTEIAKRGAKIWRRMSEKEKCKYLEMASKAPPYKRRMKRRRSKKRSRRC